MTDEEKKAIEILGEFKKNGFHLLNLKYESRVSTTKHIENSIETILNLIEKQSKEIEELKKEYERVRAGRNWLSEHISAQIATPELFDRLVEENYISKDKIKAKIEEIDKEIEVKREIAKNPMDRVSGRLLTDSIVELEKTKKVLQSLLEKE